MNPMPIKYIVLNSDLVVMKGGGVVRARTDKGEIELTLTWPELKKLAKHVADREAQRPTGEWGNDGRAQ
jgi:hypothetical protein